MRRLIPLLLLAALALEFIGAPPARALPANPWTGRWLIPKADLPCNTTPTLGITGDQVFAATQTGNRVTFRYTYPGGQSGTISGTVSADGATFTAGAAPDGWTETPPTYCFGTGHAMIQLQMAADARTFTTVPGAASQTDFGNPVNITGTYQGGGTEPRTSAPPPPTVTGISRGICPGGPWTGLWQGPSAVITIVQNGNTYTETAGGGSGLATINGFVATGTFTPARGPSAGIETFTNTMAPDGLSFDATGVLSNGAPASPFTAFFTGCPQTPLPPGPNLGTTIPSPQVLTNGPTTLVAPGVISLRSLKRSKCVLVKVASNRPARILVTIFSGRLSIRIFGQSLQVFFAPGRRQPCIPVPLRAHTFNVRTPLNVALGYTLGARPQQRGVKPRPVIRHIRLVP